MAERFSHDEMKRLRAAGLSCAKIAGEMGCSRNTVHRVTSGSNDRHNAARVRARAEVATRKSDERARRIHDHPDVLHAWAAGIVDGEGCISITVNRRTRAHNFSVNVGQSGTGLPTMLATLKDAYGGSCCSFVDKKRTVLTAWQWHLAGQMAREFLRAVQPFLVAKRAEAQLALEFYDEIEKLPRDREFPFRYLVDPVPVVERYVADLRVLRRTR